MSELLSNFLKRFTPAIGDQAKTNLATDLFKEYCKQNKITFRDLTENNRCMRFFILGFLIYQAMQNESQQTSSTN
jgi:hypothetical protein